MDFKDPKNQVLALIIIVFLALIYVWHSQFYTPYSEQLVQKKAQYQKLSTDLNAVRQKAKSLEGLQKDVDIQQARYEKVKLWLPEKKEDEAFLHQIHMAEQSTNSAVINIAPQSPVSHEFYTANTYIIELESTYNRLGLFFERVVNFPFIVTISSVSLQSRSERTGGGNNLGEKKRKDLDVIATFRLTTYNSQPAQIAQNTGGQTE